MWRWVEQGRWQECCMVTEETTASGANGRTIRYSAQTQYWLTANRIPAIATDKSCYLCRRSYGKMAYGIKIVIPGQLSRSRVVLKV